MKFTLVTNQGDRWQGLYLNGVRLAQGTELSAALMMKCLDGYSFSSGSVQTQFWFTSKDIDCFPALLEHVPQ